MKPAAKKGTGERSPEEEIDRLVHEAEVAEVAVDSVAGAAAGAMGGAIAGPVGAVAGAVIGAAVGALAGELHHRDEAAKAKHDEELDEEIGVVGGNIGEADPDMPPPRIGAFSAAASGAGGHEAPSSEGPMQNVDD